MENKDCKRPITMAVASEADSGMPLGRSHCLELFRNQSETTFYHL